MHLKTLKCCILYALLTSFILYTNAEREQKRDSATEKVHSQGQSSGSALRKLANKVWKMLDSDQILSQVTTTATTLTCTTCKAGFEFLKEYVDDGESLTELELIVRLFCVKLEIETSAVCKGIVKVFGPEFYEIARQIAWNKSEEACSVLTGDTCTNEMADWKVVFPPVAKPTVKTAAAPKEGAPTLKVLQISDYHFDPYYTEGSNADCDEPMCCRKSSGTPASDDAKAGKWGSYKKCDTPKVTVDNMLEHITQNHPDIDYILWTGDITPHDVWNQTKKENLMIIKESVDQLLEAFPNISIFPALGNHESVPVNSYPLPFINNSFSIRWLYDALDDHWQNWLPESASRTVRLGAFYSVLVRPGLRIISLNTNYCNDENWWLLLNSTDPADELQWLIYELQNAELNNEKVHVVGHIPPGHDDCLRVWSKNYYSIVNRYESTIAAQFFAHTHNDEFEIFYDQVNTTRATSIAYVGPSVTPFTDMNPGYRIYYIDGDHNETTRMVIDHETWVMNLDDANENGTPTWYKEYSARDAYNMMSLNPQDWDNLLTLMETNDTLFDAYYTYFWKSSPLKDSCDSANKETLLCNAKTARSHDDTHC